MLNLEIQIQNYPKFVPDKQEPPTVKPVFNGHTKRKPKKLFFKTESLNAGQKYCRMLSWSILQFFRPSLTSTICLRPLFCLFLSGRLRQVLLFSHGHMRLPFPLACSMFAHLFDVVNPVCVSDNLSFKGLMFL